MRPAGMSSEEESEEEFAFDMGSSSGRKKYRNSRTATPSSVTSNHSSSSVKSHGHDRAQDIDMLKLAAERGDLETMKGILKRGVAVDQVLKSGWTALMIAGSGGHHEVVKFLLENKADPNFHKELFTALMAVCSSSAGDDENLTKCADALLQQGAEVNPTERHRISALMFACKEGYEKLVQRLLAASPSLNQQDNQGWTALFWAVNKGHGRVVRMLMEAGINLRLRDRSGRTAWDLAIQKELTGIAGILSNGVEAVPENGDETARNNCAGGAKSVSNGDIADLDSDVSLMLTGMNLEDLAPLFSQKKIKLEEFLCLTDNDLHDMGLTEFKRRALLKGIRKFHMRKWSRNSVPLDGGVEKPLTNTEASLLLGNTAKHLRVLLAAISYVRYRIQDNPKSLELGQEVSHSQSLCSLTSDAHENAEKLFKEIKCFYGYIKKLEASNIYQPADIITKTEPSKGKPRRIVICVATTALIAVVLWKTDSWKSLPVFWRN